MPSGHGKKRHFFGWLSFEENRSQQKGKKGTTGQLGTCLRLLFLDLAKACSGFCCPSKSSTPAAASSSGTTTGSASCVCGSRHGLDLDCHATLDHIPQQFHTQGNKEATKSNQQLFGLCRELQLTRCGRSHEETLGWLNFEPAIWE